MYVVAFGATYLLFTKQARDRKLGLDPDDVAGFFFAAILGLLLGARVFHSLVYEPSGYYWTHPWLIFWPFDATGRMTGFQGMSYHGGAIGAAIGALIYARRRKLDFLAWADMLAVSIPLGYTAGRIGNFINGELWGKVTAAPFGMVFPNATRFDVDLPWVRAIAERAGMDLSGLSQVNLPRHPSQLYEAIFEGLVLWALLWFLARPPRFWKGFQLGAYLAGYGAIRFVIEYFREPDAELGYILSLGGRDHSIHLFESPFDFSMGQVLCLLMMAGGAGIMAWTKARSRREASVAEAVPSGSSRNAKKRLRKRLK
jgi:phosphatidylglycerol:prolipoprotein diacylglycerol transferase